MESLVLTLSQVYLPGTYAIQVYLLTVPITVPGRISTVSETC